MQSKNESVIIAVMGATGVGKSTFINLVAGGGSEAQPNDYLESCTKNAVAAKPFLLDGRSVTLVDTPGFDPTEGNEAQVLRLISEVLVNSYKEGKKLNGILYLSRISDVRVGSATPRNFCRFRKLCGDDTLKNVVIVTTMWDITPFEAAVRKEQEMAQNPALFKPAIDRGAQMARHYNTIESAHHILRIVLGFPPELLRIQRELVDEGKTLSAAMDLTLEARFIEELAKVRQQHNAMLQELDELRAREVQAVTAQLSALRVARDRLESENRALAQGLEAEKERSRRLTEEGQRRDERHRQEQAARKIEMEAAAALTRADISRRDGELLRMRAEIEAAKAREHKDARKHERERLALLMEKERLQREQEAARLRALEDAQRDAADRKKKAVLAGVLGFVLGAAATLM